jgi:hypothetical protein
MKKLTAMVMMLLMASALGGCYSKSCDTGCPSARGAMADK